MSSIHWNVEFSSGELKLRGVLQLADGDGPHPIVVMAHGQGGLKEWPNLPSVSAALVAAGIATLAFDYRNFGDSEGSVRDDVDFPGQVEDFQNAISFATTLKNIDSDRIGIWGTSLGGRNALLVAARDKRVKCVVSQVPALVMAKEMLSYMGGCSGDVAAFEQALADDKRDRAAGKEPRYVYIAGEDLSASDFEHIRSFGEAETRNWNRRFSYQSLDPDGFFDIANEISNIIAPLRFILVDHDYCAPMSKVSGFYEILPEPKSMVVMPGLHYDFYTHGKELSTNSAREWFVEHLKP